MTARRPVIISVALNGYNKRRFNPLVPIDPESVARATLGCLERGAALVHTHHEKPTDEPPEVVKEYAAAYRAVLSARPDAILSPTLRVVDRIEDRSSHFAPLAAEALIRAVPVDPGSVSLGTSDHIGLPSVDANWAYTNTYADIRFAMNLCAELGVGPQFSIYEPGFLRVVLAYDRAGMIPPGALTYFYFGGHRIPTAENPGALSFGLLPTELSLRVYLEMYSACRVPWSVAAFGADLLETPVAQVALELGGHLRIGLEDFESDRAVTNEELVEKAVTLVERSGMRVATPDEAAKLLNMRVPANDATRYG
jgi:uncharacterized protein (DUF849 family)